MPLESYRFAKEHGILIIENSDTVAKVICRPSPNPQALVELRRTLNVPFELEEVSDDEYMKKVRKFYESKTGVAMQVAEDLEEELGLAQLVKELPKTADLLETEDDAPIIRLLNAMLTEAIKLSASDIHVEAFENMLLIRIRVDGVLRNMLELPQALAPIIISRIKVMAKLDIAEKRLPQDGRITLRIANRGVDVRVSTIPASHGERVVMRLLDKKSEKLDVSELGMGEDSLQRMRELIAIPHGIILVTGPTGSGKTTTLYAVLSELNNPDRNILTIEDPVEYDLVGIGQMQVNPKIDMTFAKGLRAILRQDPDIVMVGEIRDLETAAIAVQSSLTGHLVFSTLHTNSAIGAITRLRDMGVESFLIATSIIGIVAQRLVRLLCKKCRKSRVANAAECKMLHVDENSPPTIYERVGCSECGDSGYSGRTGIYEIITIDDTLKHCIHDDVSEKKLEDHARKISPSIYRDGCARVIAGDTTLDEVMRVTSG